MKVMCFSPKLAKSQIKQPPNFPRCRIKDFQAWANQAIRYAPGAKAAQDERIRRK